MTEDAVKELKNPNSNFKFDSPAHILRFLYELCYTMVTLVVSSMSFCTRVVYPGSSLGRSVLARGRLGVGGG